MNLHGIAAAVQSIRRPGLLIPHLHVASMRHLDWHRIYASGVRYIVFDKDNCLTAPHHDQLAEPLQTTWKECRRVFGSENLLLVSNSAGSNSDPQALAAETVSSNLGIPVLCHAAKKPSSQCARQVVEHFLSLAFRRAESSSTSPLHILVIGDRITTDMVFAQRIARCLTKIESDGRHTQCTSILTKQLWGREGLGTRCLRLIESSVLQQLVRAGIPPGGSWLQRGYHIPPELKTWVVPAVEAPSLASAPTITTPEPRMRTRLKSAWQAMVSEFFGSVKHVQQLAWSALTATPTKEWRSSWRMPSSSKHLVSRSRARHMSTCRIVRAVHEKPVPRRPMPSVPEKQSPPRSLFGISWLRWALAVAALILLPLGFMGGMKLNELVDTWRSGDLSHEGERSLPPEPQVQEEVDRAVESESQLQQRKKITSLELEHYHLRRERERITEKLAHLDERQKAHSEQL